VDFMQTDGLSFIVKFFLLVVIFALGFILARDLFFIINGPSDQKNSSYAASDSSPASAKTKTETSSSRASPSAIPMESKEQVREKTAEASTSLRQDPVKNLPIDNPSSGRPLELGNGPAKNTGLNAKSLRGEEGISPVGDLRTGTDAKPTGSLRGPAESGVIGSLRPDERALPTGSLRPDEGSLPTGSLR
jgi:cytoskeletal protein RodZ